MVAKVTLIGYLLVILASSVYAQTPPTIGDSVDIIKRIIEILAPAAAIAFFIMILMGAFRFIKSAGDPKKVANARDTLKYAFFGVILVVAAWLILLLIQELTSVSVTKVGF